MYKTIKVNCLCNARKISKIICSNCFNCSSYILPNSFPRQFCHEFRRNWQALIFFFSLLYTHWHIACTKQILLNEMSIFALLEDRRYTVESHSQNFASWSITPIKIQTQYTHITYYTKKTELFL